MDSPVCILKGDISFKNNSFKLEHYNSVFQDEIAVINFSAFWALKNNSKIDIFTDSQASIGTLRIQGLNLSIKQYSFGWGWLRGVRRPVRAVRPRVHRDADRHRCGTLPGHLDEALARHRPLHALQGEGHHRGRLALLPSPGPAPRRPGLGRIRPRWVPHQLLLRLPVTHARQQGLLLLPLQLRILPAHPPHRQAENNTSALEGNIHTSEEYFAISGRRIIDINYFISQVQDCDKHSPFGCTFSDMQILSEKRNGLNTGLKMKCRMCSYTKVFWTENPQSPTMSANTAAVTDIMSIGGGFSNMEEFFSALDIPLMSEKTFLKEQEKISDAWEVTALKKWN
ncbi:hypothetical protein AVEN_125158-1 [Araneus ventricosus]|uniref:Mutator-like transposase domain-containing protein n=1 Tax=Araneus ventricosus TaxID=182803 RepID=A0A4Y2T306_ARAVE|nr:hypothetical protein AVEN_125158-1 [Araneus ventricosus]